MRRFICPFGLFFLSLSSAWSFIPPTGGMTSVNVNQQTALVIKLADIQNICFAKPFKQWDDCFDAHDYDETVDQLINLQG